MEFITETILPPVKNTTQCHYESFQGIPGIIFLWGNCVSMLGILASLVSFCLFPSLRTERGKATMNLMTALFLAKLAFWVGTASFLWPPGTDGQTSGNEDQHGSNAWIKSKQKYESRFKDSFTFCLTRQLDQLKFFGRRQTSCCHNNQLILCMGVSFADKSILECQHRSLFHRSNVSALLLFGSVSLDECAGV